MVDNDIELSDMYCGTCQGIRFNGLLMVLLWVKVILQKKARPTLSCFSAWKRVDRKTRSAWARTICVGKISRPPPRVKVHMYAFGLRHYADTIDGNLLNGICTVPERWSISLVALSLYVPASPIILQYDIYASS